MAEIRKIVRSNPLSNFTNVAPSGGGAFELLALAAETAYERLAPAAIEEQRELGSQLGRDIARSQMGDPQGAFTVSTMGGQGGGGNFREALGHSESGGNYSIVNDEGFTGKYQWGQARLDDYNRANGTSFTLEQFRQNPGVQEQAQAWHEQDILSDLGGYVGREVNGQVLDAPAIIAMAHLGGKGGARRYIESGGAYDPADSNGTKLSDYKRRFGGGNVTMSSSGGPAPTPAVMLREADGKLTSRLYSPLSGPILQAHNAAAGVAYLSEVTVKGTADLLGMSEQFMLNPEGFAEAARGYVDDMVANAPEQFRSDLRGELEQEVQRRMLGMVEERHRETRQRAANSNQALIEKWSDDLAAASVSGDLDAISAAEAKLGAALRARESLPGIAWTPEESANTIRRAREEGAKRVQDMRKQQSDTYKDSFNTIITAAKAGQVGADEAILNNQLAASLHPELYREALAFTTLRDQMPSFLKLTPQEQKAALDEFKAQPVKEAWEVDLYDAAEKTYAANAKAWEEDPIKRAGEVLPEKPPALPQFDPNNPQGFIDGLAGRAAYGNSLVEQGFTTRPVFLTKDEAQAVGAMFGKDIPPQLKAAGVAAIVNAMGKDAGKFLDQVSTADQGVKIAAGMMGSGVNPTVATEVITGQAMLDAKEVEAPRAEAVRGSYEGFRPAIEANPMMRGMAGPLRDAAIAIYAARVPVNADDATQKSVMQEAWQAALGQSKELGVIRGGVQEVAGNSAWLPPTMEGAQLDAALRKAIGADATDRPWWNFGPVIGMAPAAQPEMWSAAADGAVPMHGGKPLDPSYVSDGRIVLTPVGGTRYVLSIKHSDGTIDDVGVQGQPEGVPFVFDAERLIEAARSAP